MVRQYDENIRMGTGRRAAPTRAHDERDPRRSGWGREHGQDYDAYAASDPTAWGGVPYAPYPGAFGTGPYGRPDDWRDRYRDNPRDFWDRAGDEVASWFGDDEAERRREQDHRGRGPKGYRRSNERILEDVNDHLTHDSRVDASDITVEVSDNEVTLNGEVSSRQEKRRAEDCAEEVMGVEHVQNNLRIRRAGGDAAPV